MINTADAVRPLCMYTYCVVLLGRLLVEVNRVGLLLRDIIGSTTVN